MTQLDDMQLSNILNVIFVILIDSKNVISIPLHGGYENPILSNYS